MKNEKLLDVMGKIDDELIFNAINDTKISKRNVFLKWGAVAACLAIIIFAGSRLFLHEAEISPTPDSTELPMLAITEALGESMGYEGYLAYDISELVNANPWEEDMELATLPVYENTFSDEQSADVTFEPAVSLPEKYNFTHHASYEDLATVAKYLKKEYKNMINMNHPTLNIHGGDYNIYLQQSYYVEFFDGSDNVVEEIVNYNFNRIAFYCDDNGDLFLARIYQPDLSQKVGDYPIISTSQAKELLLSGNYITSVPYEMPGQDYIAKVELVYRTGRNEDYFMPYYRFYVELPNEERDGGLKTFGAYYVPAVDGSFISNMPVWDGSFN